MSLFAWLSGIVGTARETNQVGVLVLNRRCAPEAGVCTPASRADLQVGHLVLAKLPQRPHTIDVCLFDRELRLDGRGLDLQPLLLQPVADLKLLRARLRLFEDELGDEPLVRQLLVSLELQRRLCELRFDCGKSGPLGEHLTLELYLSTTVTGLGRSELQLGFERDGQERTLEEVGRTFGLTRERIRQVQARAMQKLRSPSRTRRRELRALVDG